MYTHTPKHTQKQIHNIMIPNKSHLTSVVFLHSSFKRGNKNFVVLCKEYLKARCG